MGFWEDIYDLRQAGVLPKVWKWEHVNECLSERYPDEDLAIYSNKASLTREGAVVAGDYMKNGAEPWAWRLGIGSFTLIEDPEDDDATRAEERSLARARCERIDRFSDPGDLSELADSLSSDAYWANLRGKPYTYIRPLDGVFDELGD